MSTVQVRQIAGERAQSSFKLLGQLHFLLLTRLFLYFCIQKYMDFLFIIDEMKLLSMHNLIVALYCINTLNLCSVFNFFLKSYFSFTGCTCQKTKYGRKYI